jgi:hypothetical protein
MATITAIPPGGIASSSTLVQWDYLVIRADGTKEAYSASFANDTEDYTPVTVAQNIPVHSEETIDIYVRCVQQYLSRGKLLEREFPYMEGLTYEDNILVWEVPEAGGNFEFIDGNVSEDVNGAYMVHAKYRFGSVDESTIQRILISGSNGENNYATEEIYPVNYTASSSREIAYTWLNFEILPTHAFYMTIESEHGTDVPTSQAVTFESTDIVTDTTGTNTYKLKAGDIPEPPTDPVYNFTQWECYIETTQEWVTMRAGVAIPIDSQALKVRAVWKLRFTQVQANRVTSDGEDETMSLETYANSVLFDNGETLSQKQATNETNLAQKSDAGHTHSTDDVTTGVLPIARGGTNGSTAAAAMYSLINGTSTLTSIGLMEGDYIGFADVSATTGRKVTLAELVKYILSSITFEEGDGISITKDGTTVTIAISYGDGDEVSY